MKENSSKAAKLGGIIASLCLIILGGMIFFFPVGSLVITTWLFTAGVGIYGLSLILAYVKTPAGMRSGWRRSISWPSG